MAAPIPECLGDAGDNCVPAQAVMLCDQHPPPDAGDGLLVPFIRIYRFDCATGTFIGSSDVALDGTPYVIEGTVEQCCCAGEAGEGVTAIQRVLCDQGADPQTCFLRTTIYSAVGAILVTFDTLADGTTPYVPVGPVDFDCEGEQDLTLTQQRRENLAGPFNWNRPGNVLSVTVKVRALGAAGSVTITDAAGTVTEMFVGDEETWEADEGILLGGTFTVIGATVGDLVTIYWTEEV